MTFPTNRGRTFPPEPLTSAEVRQLLDQTSRRAPAGVRMRALIAVLYGGGLRVSEALALRPSDVDTGHCLLRVRDGKGGRPRTVALDRRSCELVDAWLTARRDLGLTGRHPLFATYERGTVRASFGQPLSPIYVRRRLAELGAKAGIEKRVHPHGLRHSLAFDLAQRGTPTHVIQAQLGHASLAVTDRYVRHLMPADLVAAMADREW